MSEQAHEEAAAEPAAATPTLAPVANGTFDALTGSGSYTPARLLSLQRAIGNAATGRLLQRDGKGVATAPKPAAGKQTAAVNVDTPEGSPDFTPFVPTNNVDRCFRVGADAIRTAKWAIDHIVVIAGAVYVAGRDGRPTGNFTRKGSFGLRPGAYVVDGSGTAQFGYRKGKAKMTFRRIGWRTKDLPEDLRKTVEEREKTQKKAGKTGPTIFLHDFIDITEAQAQTEFGNILLFVPEPSKQEETGDQDGKAGKPDGKDSEKKEGEQKPPAVAQPGYGVDFGRPGGKRADLPPFPARIRPMSSMRGGEVKREQDDPRAALPFVYQPVRGAAVYQMAIDYTMAAPGQLLFQAAAAGVLHAYRWELWEITGSYDAALARAADVTSHKRIGEDSKTIRPTDAAYQDLGIATEDLSRRQEQYAADQRKAIAESRYFDALAGEVNQELFGLEVGFRYGKELLGLASDAMDIGRERRVPIPAEGVYVLRCVARWDPYAEREGRPIRAPSVASLIIKVKPREWLSRDALSDDDASIADLQLNQAWLKARIKAGKETGEDVTAFEKQLADVESKLAKVTSRAGDLPVAMLEKDLADKIKELTEAQQRSSLYAAGYAEYDPELKRLGRERKALEEQLAHARKQVSELQAGDGKRPIHRLKGTLVSRVTGQTYPMLLQVSEPKEDTPGVWTCRLADATTKSGKYYPGRGTSAVDALQKALEALAGDDVDGFGEGSLAVRAPAAGPWKDLDEKKRTFIMDTRPRDWAAARARLDELATVLAILALVAVPGVGEVGLALGAALAAARIIERYRNDTLHWDAELVSDIIAIASAAASGAAAVGKLRIVKQGGKFAIVAAEESSRIAKLAKLAQRANDWFLDPANIAWGNIQLLQQLKEIADQELSGALTATEARRQKGVLMANAINTNLALVGKVTGAMHEADQAFEKPKPKGKAPEPEGRTRGGATDEPARKRGAPDEPSGKRTTADERPPVPKEEGRGGPAGREPGPETPKRAAEEIPPKAAFRGALEVGGELPVAEGRRVIHESGDWKGALRRFVKELPEPLQKRAMEALAEARQQIVKEITDEAAARFGADQRNWGTPGFGSDIDLTITPKERLPGFSGKERPVADQIRASADAAEFINAKLREKLGGEPDRALDTNVYSYIAEDRVRLDTPELRARSGALEAEIGLAEARRGVDQATWAALEKAIADRLPGRDKASQRALADLRARMEAGAATERVLRAEMERVQATLREAGVPADQLAVKARDALLAAKKRQLAELFDAKSPDMIAILRLQAEIRWFAPDAYASGAAFEYTVGFGQQRRSAGVDSAEAAGRKTPTQADVLADLAASWAREQSRPEEQRMALFAAAAAAQLGMLGAHTHGTPPDQVKAAAKYAARILDLLNYSRMGGTEGTVPKALENFVRGRWPDAPDHVKNQMLVQFAMDVGMFSGIFRDPNGKAVGVTDAVMNRFVTDVRAWALDATARLMVGERTHSGATPDPVRPVTPPGPEGGPPAGGKPVEPAGGLRGRTYELTNEYTYTKGGVEHKAGGLERKTGPEKVSKAMAGLKDTLDAGAKVGAPATKHGLDFTVSVPDPAGGTGTIDVAVKVVIKPTDQLTPSEHGEHGGPARLIPSATTDATGARRWAATIEVDSRVREGDLPHVLRHEANELVGLVRKHPGGEPSGGFGPEMRARVMLPGAAADASLTPSVHDRAAVLELKALYEARDAAEPGTDAFDYRNDAIERLRESMGLNETANLRQKLRMLREGGLPTEEINRLAQAAGAELAAAHQAAEKAAGRTSMFDEALAAKTLIPRYFSDFKGQGLNGGHVTAHLLDFCAASEFHVRELASREAGGTTWRRFEQWRWNGERSKKPTSPAELPGGASFDPTKWTRSDQPKTTADDPAAYLREADGAWRAWFERHNGGTSSVDDIAVAGSERSFGGPSGNEPATSPSGVVFAGFYEKPPPRIITIFPDESWLP